jgi:hypothetical protein
MHSLRSIELVSPAKLLQYAKDLVTFLLLLLHGKFPTTTTTWNEKPPLHLLTDITSKRPALGQTQVHDDGANSMTMLKELAPDSAVA